MAVSALSHTTARRPLTAAALPPAVLLLTLIAPALDLLAVVQPGAALPTFGSLASGLASAALLLTWVRYPRTNWLAAASVAGVVGLAMRFVGADIAPALSLLAVVALGVGGAFASTAPLELF